MSIDVQGNLYVSAGKRVGAPGSERMEVGVYVISPRGEQLKVFRVPSETFSNNNAFGGPDMKTLYILAGDGLYKMKTDVPGMQR